MAKATVNMKLSSDAAVTRILHEGITTFESLTDFDDKSIERLPTICKEDIDDIHEDLANGIQREPPVSSATISSISVRRLIVAVQAALSQSLNWTLYKDRLFHENRIQRTNSGWKVGNSP